jgi:hypothetical protein
MVALRECRRALPIKSALQVEHGTMSALGDSSRTAPTWELIDDLLDNRPKIYQSAKMELLARLANTKKNTSLNWSRSKQSTPSTQKNNWRAKHHRGNTLLLL